MEEEGVIIFREQKVSVFRLPTVVISQGHYLDSWKDKIWGGELQIATNKDFLTVKLVDQTTGKLYGKSPMNSQYQQFVQKCVDSSRGYALKLVGDNDRFAWVGIGFHDRVSAFKFFSTFSDYQKILNQKNQKYEIQKKDFTLKQNQKIRINTGNNEIIEKQDQVVDFSDDDFKLNIKSKKSKKQKPKINLMDNETNFIQQLFFMKLEFLYQIIINQLVQINYSQIFFWFVFNLNLNQNEGQKQRYTCSNCIYIFTFPKQLRSHHLLKSQKKLKQRFPCRKNELQFKIKKRYFRLDYRVQKVQQESKDIRCI